MKKIVIYLTCFIIMAGMACAAMASQEGDVKVVSFSGNVRITPSDKAEAVSCYSGMILRRGDRIKTGRKAYLEIAFDKKRGNIVRVEPDSDVVVKLDGAEKIELINGEIFTVLKNLKKGEKFQVRTPCAVCGARGTAWHTKTDGKFTNVAVVEDKVSVRGVKKDGSVMEEEHWIFEGFQRKTKKSEQPGDMEKVPEKKLKELAEKIYSLVKKPLKKDEERRGPWEDEERREDRLDERKESALDDKADERLEGKYDKRDNTGGSGRETYP